MPKQTLPVYNICSLAEPPLPSIDFITDHFHHYLETHKDLHFPHKHSFYPLVSFTARTGKHSIDFVNFNVTVGQIYFMISGQVHDWGFEPGIDGFIINFLIIISASF